MPGTLFSPHPSIIEVPEATSMTHSSPLNRVYVIFAMARRFMGLGQLNGARDVWPLTRGQILCASADQQPLDARSFYNQGRMKAAVEAAVVVERHARPKVVDQVVVLLER